MGLELYVNCRTPSDKLQFWNLISSAKKEASEKETTYRVFRYHRERDGKEPHPRSEPSGPFQRMLPFARIIEQLVILDLGEE